MRFTFRKPEGVEPTERERTLNLLGMTRLREVEKTRGRAALAVSSHQELDDKDDTPWQYSLDMWRRFLPVRRQLRDYVLDSPPSDVLNELEQATLFKIYDRIEIWTATKEARSTDRLVIGVIAEDADTVRYFKVAHWGTPQTSPQEVRDSLRRDELARKRAARWKRYKPFVFVSSAVVALLLTVVMLIMLPKPAVESTPHSSPTIEVVEEVPDSSVEKPNVPSGSTESSDVDDLLTPSAGGIFERIFALMTPIFGLMATMAALCFVLMFILRLLRFYREGH